MKQWRNDLNEERRVHFKRRSDDTAGDHHLFGFPERIAVPYRLIFDFQLLHLETMLSYFGRICISIFAFCTGYGMFKLGYQRIGEDRHPIVSGYKLVLSHLKKFYPRLWAVCIAFIPIGYAMGVYHFNAVTFVKSLLGLSSAYNGEWWYTGSYLRF